MIIIPPITITYSHSFLIEGGEIIHEQVFRGYTSLDNLNAAILKWITDIQNTYTPIN